MNSLEKSPENEVRDRFEPCIAHQSSLPITDSTQLALLAVAPVSTDSPEKSPQSSPIPRRLSRKDLRDLIAMADSEVGHCGLDTAQGRRASELKGKLKAIHAQGWES